MQRKFILFCVFALLFAGNTLYSQTSLAANDANFLNINPTFSNSNSEDWSFFKDEDNQLYYIDFETINVNLSEIVVKNEQDEVVARENVADLPVNSIYELDCSEYPKGKYTIELRSYTEILKKTISVK